jgi:Na+/H+ antiporter NhaD/arsenite permease-like protein
MKTIVIILFILTYVGMLTFTKYRQYIAAATALLFIIIGVVPLKEAPGAIDWNVILMLRGTMGTVYLFIESKMPARISDKLVNRLKSVKRIFIALSLFRGFVSAFIDNVATVLMLAPIAVEISKKFEVSPTKAVLAVAVSSNLQGAATLVGDTTSILLGGYADMDFMDFFYMRGKPGIFFIVELGALATLPVLMYIFRNEKNRIDSSPITEVKDFFPTFTLLGTVLTLIGASFIPDKPKLTNGVICIVFFLITLIYEIYRRETITRFQQAIFAIDFSTLLLLCGLFIVIQGITNVGVIDDISNIFIKLSGSSLFLMYSLLVWFSVLVSAFIDNIPYVATMLPVVKGVSARMAIDPLMLYFGLLVGATLGGNVTPVGASANIAACGILRKEGYEVSTKEFMSVGVPFTLAAVLTGYILIWVIWS